MVSLDLKSDRIKFKMVWWVLYLLHMYFLSEFFFSSHQPKTQAYNRSNNIIITLTFLIGSYYRYWSISNQPQLKCHWLPHHHHHHIFHPTYCMYYCNIPLDLSHPILWSPPPLIPPWSLTNQTQATTRLSAGCWRESGSLLNFWEPCCTVQVHRFLWMFAWWYIYKDISHSPHPKPSSWWFYHPELWREWVRRPVRKRPQTWVHRSICTVTVEETDRESLKLSWSSVTFSVMSFFLFFFFFLRLELVSSW